MESGGAFPNDPGPWDIRLTRRRFRKLAPDEQPRTPGGHKPAHPSAIYVRRPAGYMKTANSSASAIQVEAYANGGPKETHYWAGGKCEGLMSAPVFVELLWVSGDHRRYWDLRTGGRTGSTGDPADFLDPNVRQFGDHRTDVDKLRAMIARAQAALDAFHAPGHPGRV